MAKMGRCAASLPEGQLLQVLPDLQHSRRVIPPGCEAGRELENTVRRRRLHPCGVRPRPVEGILRLPLGPCHMPRDGRLKGGGLVAVKNKTGTRASSSY